MRVDHGSIEALRATLRGVALTPDSVGYAEAQPIWNAMWDNHRPALIVQPAGTDDVITAVRYAREHDVPMAVRGGGHSAAGKGTNDGGMVLDLSSMKGVHVDPVAQTATGFGGNLWQDFDPETQAYGLAIPGGLISTTGIGGFTTGGGIGWLTRKYGLTCDNLIAADLVTADGELARASAEENPELFWGLRGGGGNFGVVTRFTYKMHKVGPMVTGGVLAFTLDRAEEATNAFGELLASNPPRELGCALGLLALRPGDHYDESYYWQRVAGLSFCWTGNPDDLDKVLAPFLKSKPDLQMIKQMPYTYLQKMLDVMAPHGLRGYWKSGYGKEFTSEMAAKVIEFGGAPASNLSQGEFALLGGAFADVDDNDTAFGDRSGKFVYNLVATWEDQKDDDANKKWARDYFDAMQPWSTDTVYVNFLSEEGDERIRAAYGDKFDRLAALKYEYDPDNFFRFNQNIPPIPAGKAAE